MYNTTPQEETSKMGKFAIIALAIVAAIVIGVISTIGWAISTNNTNVDMSFKYEAQKKLVETSMDKMRKDLCNQYQVNKEFAETYIKVAATQADGRKGGNMFKMVTEASGAVQGFTPEISAKMMNTISGNLAEYKRAQDTFIDIWREQNAFCTKFPNSLIVGGKGKPEPQVISSSAVKEAIKTGTLEDKLL
jgi:hypothetical protein